MKDKVRKMKRTSLRNPILENQKAKENNCFRTNAVSAKGITLVALVITIIVMIIIASITVNIGTAQIRNAKLQSYKTNMLLIEAKAREYVEKASYIAGVKPTEETNQKARDELQGEGRGTLVTTSDSILISIGISSTDIAEKNVYKLSTQDLEKMGITGVKSDEESGNYILVYNITETSVKVYNTRGFKLNAGNIKYSLDDIREIDEVE